MKPGLLFPASVDVVDGLFQGPYLDHKAAG